MRVIAVRNVHEALPEAVHLMLTGGVEHTSRNGPVLVYPTPVTTWYERPRERVLFWPQRDANPFFHLYESLWMLGGRQDVASLTRFVARMTDFSDDGHVFHGAYGYRWLHHFQFSQLELIAQALQADPTCRRQVLQIWDCQTDLVEQVGKRDVPCNLVVHFQVNRFGALDMTVFCRSNDIVWGCYGANAVHFSMLQEFMATVVGVPVGMYWHVSDNWHAYPTTFDPVRPLAEYVAQPAYQGNRPVNPYDGYVEPYPLISSITGAVAWLQDLDTFLDAGAGVMGYREPFFRHVAVPMFQLHDTFKQLGTPQRFEQGLRMCERIRATDWRMACQQWIQRRWNTWQARSTSIQ